MKKTIVTLVFILLLSISAKAVQPNWVWQKNFNAHIIDVEYHNNYLYTAGMFSDSAFVFGNANIANNGAYDAIIMKWDTMGNLIWATSIWGTGNDSAVSIEVNELGELIVAGHTSSSSINVAGNILASNGGQDVFIARYDLNGNYINAYIYGTAANELVLDMCTDYTNAIYIAGKGNLKKYSNAGAFIWQQNLPVSQIEYSKFDSTIIASGLFKDTLTLGNFSVIATPWIGMPSNDVFVAKISLSNTPLWLVNTTYEPKDNFSLILYVHDQTGRVFVGSSYMQLQLDNLFSLMEVSPAGIVSNTGINLLQNELVCLSVSGNDSLISLGIKADVGADIYIYNIYTYQQVRVYWGAGIGPFLNGNIGPSFQCFRGLHSIYTVFGGMIDFGKIGGSLLFVNPTNQTYSYCVGTTVTLTANVTGGEGAIIYSWLPVTGLNNTNTNTVTFTATSNISYTLTATDGIGQVVKDTFNIIVQNPLPQPNITSQFPAFCADSMSLYSNNGIPGQWRRESYGLWFIFDYDTTTTIHAPGKYSYEGSNVCGSVTDTIEILSVVNVIASASSDSICEGQSVTLSGGGALTYTWSGGVVDNVPFAPLTTQTYTVTGFNAAGCSDTATIKIVVKTLPDIAGISASPDIFCNQGNSVLAVTFNPYCVPTVQNPPNGTAIVEFTFAGISNNTGLVPGLYTYYNMTANVTAGSTYPVSILKNGNGIPADSRTVWIDYNQDGDFEDAAETVFYMDDYNYVVNGNITIPANAPNGITRIRVGGKYEDPNTPCYNNNWGEYEDYNLSITGGVDQISWQPLTFLPNNIGNNINVVNINATTTYTVSIADVNGCTAKDSISITVNPTIINNTNTAICPNQLPYIWNGQVILAGGTYTDTNANVLGCDSIEILNLTLNPVSASTTNTSVCANQLPYTWNGQTLIAAGTYTYTTLNVYGCDSVITMILTVNPVTNSITNWTICNNQLPYIWNGQNINSPGTYTFITLNVFGCDSTATLNLTINDTSFSNTDTFVCFNLLPVTWNGLNIAAAGSYSFTTLNAAGCDSLATLNLSVYPQPIVAISPFTDTTICFGAPYTLYADSNFVNYSWTLNGNVVSLGDSLLVNASGTYIVNCIDTSGCSASDTVTINYLPAPQPIIVQNNYTLTCTNVDSVNYQWLLNNNAIGTNDSTLAISQNGTYVVITTDSSGCIGTDTLVVIALGSIGNISENPSILVYPNPATNQLTIEYTLDQNSVITIEFNDLAGKVIAQIASSEKQLKGTHKKVIRLNDYGVSRGVYFLQINNGISKWTRRIVVQ